jgi:hypothetical protein
VFETDLSVYWTHSNDRVPGSLEEETESLSTYQVETGVDHLLHQYRALGRWKRTREGGERKRVWINHPTRLQ